MLSLLASTLALFSTWNPPPRTFAARSHGIEFRARLVGEHCVLSLTGQSIGKRGVIGVGTVRCDGAVVLHGDLRRELREKEVQLDDVHVLDDAITLRVCIPPTETVVTLRPVLISGAKILRLKRDL